MFSFIYLTLIGKLPSSSLVWTTNSQVQDAFSAYAQYIWNNHKLFKLTCLVTLNHSLISYFLFLILYLIDRFDFVLFEFLSF